MTFPGRTRAQNSAVSPDQPTFRVDSHPVPNEVRFFVTLLLVNPSLGRIPDTDFQPLRKITLNNLHPAAPIDLVHRLQEHLNYQTASVSYSFF